MMRQFTHVLGESVFLHTNMERSSIDCSIMEGEGKDKSEMKAKNQYS